MLWVPAVYAVGRQQSFQPWAFLTEVETRNTQKPIRIPKSTTIIDLQFPVIHPNQAFFQMIVVVTHFKNKYYY